MASNDGPLSSNSTTWSAVSRGPFYGLSEVFQVPRVDTVRNLGIRVEDPRYITGDLSVQLRWSAPRNRFSGSENTVSGYEYRYASGSSIASSTSWTSIDDSWARSVTIAGLLNGTQYTFEVRTKYTTDPVTYGTPVAVTTKTPTPRPIMTTRQAEGDAGNTTIVLRWNGIAKLGSEAVTGYEIEEAPKQYGPLTNLTTSSETGTEYEHTGLSRGVLKWYRVRVTSANNSKPMECTDSGRHTSTCSGQTCHIADGRRWELGSQLGEAEYLRSQCCLL